MGKFKVTGRYMKGLELGGLWILSEDASETIVKMEEIYEMASNGLIEGYSLVNTNKGDKVLYSKDIKIKDLPIVRIDAQNGINITARLMRDKELIGYEVINSAGRSFKITLEKAWELSASSSLDGIDACVMDGKKIIKGVREKLGTLPIIEV